MSVSKARMPDVCSAIEDDLCTLLQAFKEKASLRLVKFYEVAADYRLQDVYAGRLNVAEYLEFAECYLRSAFTYTGTGEGEGTAKAPRSILERVFGIYVTYFLYYGQASDYLVKIPTTCSDLDLLLNFVKSTLIPYRHLDAVGCIYKLVYDDAFAITPFHNDYDPATQKKYYSSTMKDGEDHEQENYVPLEITRSILEGPVFKTMLRVQTQMTDIGKFSCDPNLQITEKDTSFTERIEEIFVQLQNELADVDKEKVPDNTELHPEVKTEEANDESLGKSRSSIRDRAFNSVISFCRGKRAIHSEDQVNNVIVKTESPDAASESELRAVKEEPQEGSQCENNSKEGKFTRKTPMRDTAKSTTDGIEKANRNGPHGYEQTIVKEEPASPGVNLEEPKQLPRRGEGIEMRNDFTDAILQLDISKSDPEPVIPKLGKDFEIAMSRAEAALCQSYEKKIVKLEQ
ncbi:hypothetical protein V3C99_000876 [Haemonchus contortus]